LALNFLLSVKELWRYCVASLNDVLAELIECLSTPEPRNMRDTHYDGWSTVATIVTISISLKHKFFSDTLVFFAIIHPNPLCNEVVSNFAPHLYNADLFKLLILKTWDAWKNMPLRAQGSEAIQVVHILDLNVPLVFCRAFIFFGITDEPVIAQLKCQKLPRENKAGAISTKGQQSELAKLTGAHPMLRPRGI
jgi:hypothetical protein